MGSSHSSQNSYPGGYRTRVYLHPQPNAEPLMFDEPDLQQHLAPLIGDEVITSVALYKHPIYSWQLTSFLLYHAFVVFQTDCWWWSIEKDAEGLTLQRSKNRHEVVNKRRCQSRAADCELIMTDEAQYPLKTLADMLYASDVVRSEYSAATSNSKHFAQLIYNKLAIRTSW
eukprot:scpid86226/ scgid26215/ 